MYLCIFVFLCMCVPVCALTHVCLCLMCLSVLVPCVPERLEGNVDCESGEVAVSWEPSNGATSYTAMAEGGAGYTSLCNSSSTVCVFSDLLCGLSYSISVLASDSTCSSPYSSSIQVDTGEKNAHVRTCTNINEHTHTYKPTHFCMFTFIQFYTLLHVDIIQYLKNTKLLPGQSVKSSPLKIMSYPTSLEYISRSSFR